MPKLCNFNFTAEIYDKHQRKQDNYKVKQQLFLD